MAAARDTLVTSFAVITEFERAPESKRLIGLALLKALPLLDLPGGVGDLVTACLLHKVMPRDGEGDALHLAVATFHGCDILATWNCRHIANANKQAHIRSVNGRLGYAPPGLVTPLGLLGIEG